MGNTNSSTITPQYLIRYARTFDWCRPVVGEVGYTQEPALSFANDIMQKIIAQNNPWKWNSYQVPVFYTQPYQQDYPTSVSQDAMGWCESGTFIDINNTQTPKPQPLIQAVARLQPTFICGIPTQYCWIPNRNAILGTWPGNSVAYTNPLVSAGGGPGNNPLTAILDPNGNIEVVTQYGTTVSTGSPTWPAADASAGTVTDDGTVQWTVQDPNGVTFRLDRMNTNNSNIWEMHLFYQQKAPLITTLGQSFDPIPDDLGYLIRQGFLTLCYKKADKNTFQVEYAQWLKDIQDALMESDREVQSFGISPLDPLQGPGGMGPAGSYGYPGWSGWSSNGY